METKNAGSQKLVQDLLQRGKRFDAKELMDLSELASQAGGEMVGISGVDDDNRCGNGHFRFKHPKGVGSFVEQLLERRIDVDWIINGIPRIDEILVNVHKAHVGK